MVAVIKNIVVVGGSYVGVSAAKELAGILPTGYRVLLVEPHSHFHHLFAFPRFAVLPTHEHKAFIPYRVFENTQNAVVRAKALEVHPDHLLLDRPWEGSTQLPFSYLTIATGTRLTPPGTMESEDKLPSVKYFQEYQNRVLAASSIVIIGGGAVGVQMATDLKELYPSKKVTLVQSRDRVMPKFHPQFNDLIMQRFAELGVDVITGNRVVVPEGGFPSDGSTFAVQLKDGREIETQLVIPATGQIANNELVRTLPDQINPDNGFIRVQPTLQLRDYPNIFAVGDIADTGAHKAARPGMAQAAAVAKNIRALIDGNRPTEKYTVAPAGIHLTLGLQKNIVFRNPPTEGGEPSFTWRDDGTEDMNIGGVWERRGVRVNCIDDYHL